MGLSIFLAKWLGLYLLIIALAWVVRRDHLSASIKEIVSSRGLIVFSGFLNIVLGLAIAIGHPIWAFNWIGLITLVGYLMIIGGVIRLVFPEKVQEYTLNMMKKGYWVFIAVLVILGGFLTYSGFMHSLS